MSGPPSANAPAVVYPDRTSVASVADGVMLMLLGELATTVEYGLNVKVCVVSNDTLDRIKWEQMLLQGNRAYGVEFRPIDFAKVAEGIGARRLASERPGDAARVVADAMWPPGTVVVNALVDPPLGAPA